MKKPNYSLTCSLVLESDKPDRFYMDLRAYSIIPLESAESKSEPSLVWRGLYLAYQVEKPQRLRLPSQGAGPEQSWS